MIRLPRMRLIPLFLLLTSAYAATTYSNPVLAGDYPDPSVIRVGNEFWATATTSAWAPVFPLLVSRDLVNWQIAGSVFTKPPAWSDGSYWAPEISQHNGTFTIYYTGRKKGGPLCVASATAVKVSGPYTDNGPLVCQEAGSIDSVPVTDEHGQRYLIWKEDGNSRKLPTPLWAQRLSEDGTKLVGERKEILRNEAPWEGHLIEGPFVLKRNGYFYIFYSAGACCGSKCDYRLGVARAKSLLGPWERYSANPILAGNQHWRCPGHGSIVETADGRTFLMYHGYHPKDFQFAGRQALLDEVRWSSDGWPSINDGKGPSASAASPFGKTERNAEYAVDEEFKAAHLGSDWQWPYANEPRVKIAGGKLHLAPQTASDDPYAAAVLARTTTLGDYTATAAVIPQQGEAGLAAYGNPQNAIGISAGPEKITLWRREKNRTTVLAEAKRPVSPITHLRYVASDGKALRFSYSPDGHTWSDLPASGSVDGTYLPPWDLAIRVALVASGGPATFESIRIAPNRAPTSPRQSR